MFLAVTGTQPMSQRGLQGRDGKVFPWHLVEMYRTCDSVCTVCSDTAVLLHEVANEVLTTYAVFHRMYTRY